ncbi:MAG TPA: multicopper oxidase domain-containing protein [Alloacidobacterium sp.]|nr:multicopper oxidase domain-containing protein [Alloacidobacterium sp.]
MQRSITPTFALVAASVMLFAACGMNYAQAQVHPFEEPPSFTETKPPAGNLFAVREATQQTCQPQGSISRNGNIVSVKLNFVRADFTINNPDPTDPYHGEDPVTLRSYGGCKSGPTIEVNPGNTLRIELDNQLSANDPSCYKNPPSGLSLPPGVGCFNTINLHTHGLHVSPAGNSDNVLLNIAPQTNFPYEINIPSDHPAGTFWYHAHRHGSTAVQVSSGASGMLIIRGNRPYTPPTPENPHPMADIDTILHDADGGPMKEQLFHFEQMAYACFKNDPSLDGGPWQEIYTTKGLYDIAGANSNNPPPAVSAPWVCPKPTPDNFVSRGVIENFALQLDSPTIWDTNGRFTSVNGIVQPTMTIAAGEIQRWRFLHAGIHDTINLQIVRAASPAAGAADLIATSALSGNREQQKADLAKFCPAMPQTLIPQFEIAVDGLTLTKIHTLSGVSVTSSNGSNYLQPGYRSDVLVVFPEDGYYCLLDQAAPPQERVNNGKGGQGPSIPQLLAYIRVEGGHPVTTDLQTYVFKALYDRNGNGTLPEDVRKGLLTGNIAPWAPFTDLGPVTPGSQLQHAHFAINFQGNTVLFQINGKSYDPNVVNVTRQVNTTDDWLLTADGEPHIFHIHVNPFEVMDVTRLAPDGSQESIFDKDGNCRKDVVPDTQGLGNQYCDMYHVFRDTVFVENGYQVHIRTHYDRYIGEYVIHCHILDHEDGGMMMNINIVPDLHAPGGGLGMAGMSH